MTPLLIETITPAEPGFIALKDESLRQNFNMYCESSLPAVMPLVPFYAAFPDPDWQ